jgi:hypothetical protein
MQKLFPRHSTPSLGGKVGENIEGFRVQPYVRSAHRKGAAFRIKNKPAEGHDPHALLVRVMGTPRNLNAALSDAQRSATCLKSND